MVQVGREGRGEVGFERKTVKGRRSVAAPTKSSSVSCRVWTSAGSRRAVHKQKPCQRRSPAKCQHRINRQLFSWTTQAKTSTPSKLSGTPASLVLLQASLFPLPGGRLRQCYLEEPPRRVRPSYPSFPSSTGPQ